MGIASAHFWGMQLALVDDHALGQVAANVLTIAHQERFEEFGGGVVCWFGEPTEQINQRRVFLIF